MGWRVWRVVDVGGLGRGGGVVHLVRGWRCVGVEVAVPLAVHPRPVGPLVCGAAPRPYMPSLCTQSL